jgi:FixJ family two-component response regulator
MALLRPESYPDTSPPDYGNITASSFTGLEVLDAEGSILSASNGHPVWLLDDDASMLKALDRLLRSAGFTVKKFNHPEALLSNLEQEQCRVAVLDVWMPEMNGLEVQSSLRRNSPETRIIFITGRDDPSVRQTALDAGAFAFLSKPFDDEVLVQLIQKATGA